MDLFPIFLLIISATLLYAPISHARDRRQTARRTEVTTGRVIGHETQTSTTHSGVHSRGVPTRHAVIAFEVNGVGYRFVSPNGASWIIDPVDSTKEVWYDPRDPSNAGLPEGELDRLMGTIMRYVFPAAGLGILVYLAITQLPIG